jgi:hypothetical protein
MSLVETMSLFDKICYKNNQNMFFDYIYFKQLATKDTYSFIIQLIVKNIDAILSEHDQFDGHVSFKTITIGDIDKHFGFWRELSGVLKNRYKMKLNICCVYDIPSFFAKCYDMCKVFIDKDTQSKIQIDEKYVYTPLKI